MKATKLFLGMLALTSAMTFVSCNSEDGLNEVVATDQATVTFTTSLPTDLISRAATGVDNNTSLSSSVYGDGTKATTLYYAVYTYNAEGNTLVLTNYGKEGDNCYVKDDVNFVNLNAKVSFTLANGTAYKFVFWAQSPKAEQYSFNPATGDINIDYSKVICNDDNQDAFFASVDYTFSQGTSQSVTLTRPFAQLNVGLTDYARAKEVGMEVAQSSLSIYKIPNTMNLITGEIPVYDAGNLGFGSSDVNYDDALYSFNTTPAKQANAGRFPAKENGEYVDAEYEAMVYILATDKVYDIQFNYMSTTGVEKSYSFFSVPLKPNHRTNIYGGLLLTNQEWTISINQNFLDPDMNESSDDFIPIN